MRFVAAVYMALVVCVASACSSGQRTRTSAVLPDESVQDALTPVFVSADLDDVRLRERLDGAAVVHAVNTDDRVCRFLAECETLLVLHIYLEWMGSGPPPGELTDVGLEALAASRTLTLLTIEYESGITDDGLRALWQDERHLFVYVYECSGVSREFSSGTSATRFQIEVMPEPPDPAYAPGDAEMPDD